MLAKVFNDPERIMHIKSNIIVNPDVQMDHEINKFDDLKNGKIGFKCDNAYQKETNGGGIKTKFHFFKNENKHNVCDFFEILKER